MELELLYAGDGKRVMFPRPIDTEYTCEHDGCGATATVEFVSYDNEGSEVFYTYRCDNHPVKDESWEVVDL